MVDIVCRRHFPHFQQSTGRLYIHRIGRSGRFGRKGVAINFARPPSWAASAGGWCGVSWTSGESMKNSQKNSKQF